MYYNEGGSRSWGVYLRLYGVLRETFILHSHIKQNDNFVRRQADAPISSLAKKK